LPGEYDYKGRLTGLNAVAMAGGFTYRARKKTLKVLRDYDGNSADAPPDRYRKIDVKDFILPGDVLLVEERWF